MAQPMPTCAQRPELRLTALGAAPEGTVERTLAGQHPAVLALDVADWLGLTADQRSRLKDVIQIMQLRAFGAAMELETARADLNTALHESTPSDDELMTLITAQARARAVVEFVQLSAGRDARAILAPAQSARLDQAAPLD